MVVPYYTTSLNHAHQVREQIREGEGPRLPPGPAVDMRHIAQRRHSTVSKCSVPLGGFPKARGMETRRVRTHRVNDLNLRGCYVGIVHFDGGRSA